MLKFLLRSLLVLVGLGILFFAIEPIFFYFTSKPVEVKILDISKSIHRSSGYGGRGGKSFTQFNVSLVKVGDGSNQHKIYDCFSSNGNTDEWLMQDDKYAIIKNARNSVVVGRESITGRAVCLYADVSLLKLSIYLFASISLLALAVSYPVKGRRFHGAK